MCRGPLCAGDCYVQGTTIGTIMGTTFFKFYCTSLVGGAGGGGGGGQASSACGASCSSCTAGGW